MAQERLLRARHQQAHDVVADAGEVFHLRLGEVGCRDALEALLVGLLTGHVEAPYLVAVSTKMSSSSSMTMKSMPFEPCAQFSSRTSMSLCFRFALITSCDLSSMLFLMAVCLLVLGDSISRRDGVSVRKDCQNEVGDVEKVDFYRTLETRKNTKRLLSTMRSDEVDEVEFTEPPV